AVAAITTAAGASSASSTSERPEGTMGDLMLPVLAVRRSRTGSGTGPGPRPALVEGRGGAAPVARRAPPSPGHGRRHVPIASGEGGSSVGRSLRRLGLFDEPGDQFL